MKLANTELLQTKVIIGIGVLIGLLLFKKTKPGFLKAILIGLSVCFGLGFFTVFPIGSIAFYSFGALALVFAIWCIRYKNWIGFIVGFFTFLSSLWMLFAYPNYSDLQLLMIVPLVCYIWAVIKQKNYKNELSVMTVLAGYEFSELLRIVGTWIE